MASPGDLPRDFRQGDEVTSILIGAILNELWRWRRADAAPPLAIDNVDSDEPPVFTLFDGFGVVPAKTGGGAVAAGSLATPTAFTATVLVPNYGGATASLTTTGGASITGYNAFTSSIAAGSLVWLVNVYGFWYVIAANC